MLTNSDLEETAWLFAVIPFAYLNEEEIEFDTCRAKYGCSGYSGFLVIQPKVPPAAAVQQCQPN